MCPNCILNQAGMQPGLFVAFFICGLFFVIGLVAMLWAFKNGEFEDIESSKFDMLDDDENSSVGTKARAAVDKLRARES